MAIEVPTIQPRVIPVTAESIADAPDLPLSEDVNGIAELSARAAIMSRKGKPVETETVAARVVAGANAKRKVHHEADRAVIIQAEAAKVLLQQLRESGNADDEQLVADTIEGETNFVEAVERAISEIDDCEVLISGLKAKEEAFETRRKLIEARADRIRAVVEQAMLSTEQLSLRLTTATLSLSRRKPGLVILNDADIPARFWVEPERPAPKLDKKALAEALAANQDIPGATLDNGSFSLSVRRK